jgi:hypothetical protein
MASILGTVLSLEGSEITHIVTVEAWPTTPPVVPPAVILGSTQSDVSGRFHIEFDIDTTVVTDRKITLEFKRAIVTGGTAAPQLTKQLEGVLPTSNIYLGPVFIKP